MNRGIAYGWRKTAKLEIRGAQKISLSKAESSLLLHGAKSLAFPIGARTPEFTSLAGLLKGHLWRLFNLRVSGI